MTTRPSADPEVHVLGRARLPTRHGEFEAVAFRTPDGLEHLALLRGDVKDGAGVPVRMHSECLTGDSLGSLRCDCREQLETALQFLGREPVGVLLYLRQEGRGIGLANKVLAYALQDHGLDTADANVALGFAKDERVYDIAAAMLGALEVASVVLLTNNPAKITGLETQGVRVLGRAPLLVRPNAHNERYLAAKKAKLGHLLDEASSFPEQRAILPPEDRAPASTGRTRVGPIRAPTVKEAAAEHGETGSF